MPAFNTTYLSAVVATCLAGGVFAAECITNKGNWNAYKATLAKQAAAQGVGQRGQQALASAKLSDITWRFESKPSSQTGVSQGDPARFLAKRSGASAQAFVNRVKGKILDIGYLGNLSTYHVALPEGPVVKCAVTNRSRLARRDFTWDDEVWLSWTDTAGLVLAS